ncbi:hypothetical protein NC651_023012 [Populus alba x Populus x berolinensis]|nr:hypothetical protein NC651_023012 [Populus alba x Populus x berolinensis]
MEYILALTRQGIAKDFEKYCSISASSDHGYACATCLSWKLCLNSEFQRQKQTRKDLNISSLSFISLKMISAKKLVKLARKWQKLAAISRKRLTSPQTISSLDSDDCSTSSTAEKGHFVIVKELFNLAEEEFGLTSNGPLTLPCDAAFMEYAITMIKKNVAKDVEKALLITLASNRCSSSDLNISFLCFISLKMISAKKLVKLARKWQKLAAISRKRLPFPQTVSSLDSDDCSTSSTAEKGHFVVYTTDEKRFVLPLDYLNNEIVKELFNLAEEEFGLTSNGPLTLPCDAAFMEYSITMIKKNVAKDVEKALLITLASNRCSSTLYPHQEVRNQEFNIVRQLLVMSEEEFGLPGDGPITLPCDAVFMEYVCSSIQGRVDREIEKAMLMSVLSSRSCSLSSCPSQGQTSQQSLVYSF